MSQTIKRLVFGSDHGGFDLKQALMARIRETYPHIECVDLGVTSNTRVDYPDYADKVVQDVQAAPETAGILVCGTGIGISMRANRYRGIRAALVHDSFTAEMAKAHNNANVLCLGGRTVELGTALICVRMWLDTAYEGGRHDERLEKLDRFGAAAD